MNQDYFKNKAGSYEQNQRRVGNVDSIARTILDNVELQPSMHLMDFGSGTGLLLERIAPQVKKITAIDISHSMNQQLQEKAPTLSCELEILPINLEQTEADLAFDGIISSMTMHHIRDIESMFSKFYAMLPRGGFIAIADLDSEDGSFHTEDTGVCHLGFDRNFIGDVVSKTGFNNVEITTASVIQKPHREFPVFMLRAYR